MNSIPSIIRELESVDLSQSSPDTIRNILDKLISRPLPILVTILPPNSYIYRARDVNDFGEIESQASLTYRRADQNTRFNRASSPGNTMFYGIHSVIESPADAGKAATGSMIEACNFLREPPTQKENKAVVGVWQVVEPLQLFTIIDPEWENNPANTHRQYVAQFDDVFSENPEINMSEAKVFHSFFYNQFNKPVLSDQEYWIPALVTPDLTRPYDGIKYESVQCMRSKLNGLMCVALKPESVDRKLVLSHVEAYTYSLVESENRFTMKHSPFILPTHRS